MWICNCSGWSLWAWLELSRAIPCREQESSELPTPKLRIAVPSCCQGIFLVQSQATWSMSKLISMLQCHSQTANIWVSFWRLVEVTLCSAGATEVDLDFLQKEVKLCHIMQEHHLMLDIWNKAQYYTIIASNGWWQFCQTNITCPSQKDSIFNIVSVLEAFPISVY